jgi:hypothetical protein
VDRWTDILTGRFKDTVSTLQITGKVVMNGVEHKTENEGTSGLATGTN